MPNILTSSGPVQYCSETAYLCAYVDRNEDAPLSGWEIALYPVPLSGTGSDSLRCGPLEGIE